MIKHKGTKTIETIRLILRKFELQDVPDMFYNWASDPKVCEFLPWGPYKEMETVKNRIHGWIEQYDRNNYYNWAICLKRNGEVVGSISVEIFNDKEKTCEIGYCLGSEYWCCGIMTETLRAIMHYMFYDIGYQKVVARHDILNVASGRVMQKTGMKLKKKIKSSIRRDGTYSEIAIYEKEINT